MAVSCGTWATQGAWYVYNRGCSLRPAFPLAYCTIRDGVRGRRAAAMGAWWYGGLSYMGSPDQSDDAAGLHLRLSRDVLSCYSVYRAATAGGLHDQIQLGLDPGLRGQRPVTSSGVKEASSIHSSQQSCRRLKLTLPQSNYPRYTSAEKSDMTLYSATGFRRGPDPHGEKCTPAFTEVRDGGRRSGSAPFSLRDVFLKTDAGEAPKHSNVEVPRPTPAHLRHHTTCACSLLCAAPPPFL